MEPDRQMEIQLGHMCNNRCVFCVSGQRTEMREAHPLPGDPILAKIKELYDSGGRRLTFVGGEPTLQPSFLDAVKYAVTLGFEEIVVHTNGAKTARAEFVDEILALGGNIHFRLSFQGATREAHERTTLKPGSFQRLVHTMANVHERKRRISVNMCVVQSNFASIEAFPALLLPYGVSQLHLDMLRPLDAGTRSAEEMAAMLPKYSEMRGYLESMIQGFPQGFDVNIGNLPYCIAPKVARWIHHDGQTTFTVAIDGDDSLSDPWNKYEVKRRDKIKKESCSKCVFDSQCSGYFETYRDIYGDAEFQPVTREQLLALDPQRSLFVFHFEPVLQQLRQWQPPAPWKAPMVEVNSIDHRVTLSFEGPSGFVRCVLTRPTPRAAAATQSFALTLLEIPDAGTAVRSLLEELFAFACNAANETPVHPLGDDFAWRTERPTAHATMLDPRLGQWLRVLRAKAPFGELAWRGLRLSSSGREVQLQMEDRAGGRVRVVLGIRNGQLSGKYELVDGTTASPALREGLRALFELLRTPDSVALQTM